MRLLLASLLLAVLSACGEADDGMLDVAFIAGPEELDATGLRLGSAGQHLRAAQAQGLVRIDATGEVVPGVAERWIVTDDGSSYIFRIREFDLAGDTRLTAQGVRDALQRRLRQLKGTSLGLDLAKVRDIRAMTGRVIEIRLTSPMPDFLQLLAQPELGIELGDRSAALMRRSASEEGLLLEPLAPEARGLPEQPGWDEVARDVRVHADSARGATEGFARGTYDLVLGGRLASLPLASAGPLSRGNIRLDAAVGLFGFDVVRRDGFLALPEQREALALAIDRSALLEPFNIGGWVPSTRIVPPALYAAEDAPAERWEGMSIEARRAEARRRVARWQATSGRQAEVRIALPPGPGSDTLFDRLAADFGTIGVSASRADDAASADLVLRDRVARYASPRWFLNQFNCAISRAQCSEDADYLVSLALDARDAAEESSYLAEAENTLLTANLYIPLGAPIRWSLVRADIADFHENPWNVHPLFPLSNAPI